MHTHVTGISSNADDTTITGNTIEDAAGAGVRVGTNEPDEDGRYFGVDNTVRTAFLKGVHKLSVRTGSLLYYSVSAD